jgi:hypothetical protein
MVGNSITGGRGAPAVIVQFSEENLERETGIEPATSGLGNSPIDEDPSNNS